MKTEDIDKKIGMPDVDAEWQRFEQEVIEKESGNIRLHKKLDLSKKIAAIVILGLCFSGVGLATVFHVGKPKQKELKVDTNVNTKQLVTAWKADMPEPRVGYSVHLCPGTWVSYNDSNWLEEENFEFAYPDKGEGYNRNLIFLLDGKPVGMDQLFSLTNKELKKLEMREVKDSMTVNLITKMDSVPVSVNGNLPREMTILLPGNGQIWITENKAQEGNWMNCSCTTWEETSYGWSVAKEIGRVKDLPGFKVYVYSSTETKQEDLDRAADMLKEVGVKDIIYRKNLPIKHFSDEELRLWAENEKHNGTRYADLYNKMAQRNMPIADVKKQWNVVRGVYGVK